ncbi:DUF2683 family protein [Parapedobacter sp. GCM10030251]
MDEAFWVSNPKLRKELDGLMVSESQFRNRCNLVSHFCSWQLFRIFTKKNGPNMQTLIVQPENKEQLLAVESVLKLLKINFVVEEDEALPTYVADGTKESMLEAQAGKLTPFTSIREMLDVK